MVGEGVLDLPAALAPPAGGAPTVPQRETDTRSLARVAAVLSSPRRKSRPFSLAGTRLFIADISIGCLLSSISVWSAASKPSVAVEVSVVVVCPVAPHLSSLLLSDRAPLRHYLSTVASIVPSHHRLHVSVRHLAGGLSTG